MFMLDARSLAFSTYLRHFITAQAKETHSLAVRIIRSPQDAIFPRAFRIPIALPMLEFKLWFTAITVVPRAAHSTETPSFWLCSTLEIFQTLYLRVIEVGPASHSLNAAYEACINFGFTQSIDCDLKMMYSHRVIPEGCSIVTTRRHFTGCFPMYSGHYSRG